jgi:Ser/Thr protein kinase RdoA (MazF antagonist)
VAGDFFRLTPDQVLRAVEQSGRGTTGVCSALNSLENRVYDVELDDRSHVVAKFYRPGRWSRDTIADEHRLLAALVEAEIPACAPLAFPDGDTLRATEAGIWFALFPRVGGRSPDELSPDDLAELGRLIARIHNVSAAIGLRHRPALSPASYGADSLRLLLDGGLLPPALAARFEQVAHAVIDAAERRWRGAAVFPIHADCHRANLLRGSRGWFFLDFDDMAVGPAVQDLWLLLPARPADCAAHRDALLSGYETFRPLDRATLALVEALRALRYLRYAAWIASRWDDPSFPRAYPEFGTDRYWQEQLADLHDQLALLSGDGGWHGGD